MGAVLTYTLFCVVVIVGVVAGFVAGYPVNAVGTLGVWAVAAGAIGAVLLRFRNRRG